MFTRRLFLSTAMSGTAVAIAAPTLAQPRAAIVPLRLERTRMLVEAVIDGAAPVPLIVDTGAHISLISDRFARERKLREVGKTPAIIAGTRDRYPVVEANRVVIDGGVDVGKIAFATMPVPGLGAGSVGSISGGLVTILDSQFDFPNRRLLIFPDGGPSRAGWFRHDRGIERERTGTAYLDARVTIGGRPVDVRLDTGSPSGLLLSETTLRRVVPDAQSLNWSPTPTRDGFARMVRLPGSLTIGTLVVDRPMVRLPSRDERFGHDLVGYPIIRRLDLATAVKEGVFYTRPNGLDADDRDYNRSGLYVGRRGAALYAQAVGRGSPAEAAGIRTGAALAGMDFSAMIRALNGPAGSKASIVVDGRPVDLTLRDYL